MCSLSFSLSFMLRGEVFTSSGKKKWIRDTDKYRAAASRGLTPQLLFSHAAKMWHGITLKMAECLQRHFSLYSATCLFFLLTFPGVVMFATGKKKKEAL